MIPELIREIQMKTMGRQGLTPESRTLRLCQKEMMSLRQNNEKGKSKLK